MSNRHNRQELLALKPILKAYAFGYLFTTSPTLIRILTAVIRTKLDPGTAFSKLQHALREATGLHHFAAFCGTLVAGSILLQNPFRALLALVLRLPAFTKFRAKPSEQSITRLSRLLAAFTASWLSFTLLNGGLDTSEDAQSSEHAPAETQAAEFGNASSAQEANALATYKLQDITRRTIPQGIPIVPARALSFSVQDSTIQRGHLSGKTIDLTLFVFVRAMDIVLTSVWRSKRPHSKISQHVANGTPPALFAFSATTIMWAWFYAPHALPRTYLRWISAAANLDGRLLLALRHARYGDFVYGKETGIGPLLGSLAVDCGLPFEKGDPAKTIPVACDLVHQGTGHSCEYHAISRFWRGWLFAAKMYAPIQVVLLASRLRNNPKASLQARLIILVRTIADIARSSAFLGAFISMVYYGVCLGRTRLGPYLFDRKTVTPQMWDGGLCVLSGCLLCGTSIMVERPARRPELMFFVLPRALGAWFPRRYPKQYQWKEQLAFATSTAVVVAAAQENSSNVRGILGALLHRILT